MLTEKHRQNRIPIMMTDDEVKAIDDWRFANRVQSRSEAARELIKAGLEAKGKQS